MFEWLKKLKTCSKSKPSTSIELYHDEIHVEILEGPYLCEGSPTPDAINMYRDLVARLTEFLRFAADRLLSLYNDSWFSEEIGVLNTCAFLEGLVNPSILVQDELGAALVYFEDGGTFAGHDIEVTISNGHPSHAEIVG